MISYGFFNARKMVTGTYDRKYNADDVNTYFQGAFSQDGIYQFVGNQCRVKATTGMSVVVQDGKGQINYHWFKITSNETVDIKVASATLNRWTAIVMRYDETNRNIYLTTIDGEDGERPDKPAIIRNGSIRDICLAYVYVKAGMIEITDDDITDTIEESSVCGYIYTLLSNSASSGIEKVSSLPLPTKSCAGKIYYLSVDNGGYPRGFYACSPSSFIYGFEEIGYTTGAFNNRPIARDGLYNTCFYATDISKWYLCTFRDNEYLWDEITVDEVTELPTPGSATFEKFYLKGISLYEGVKVDTDYTWVAVINESGFIKQTDTIQKVEYVETYPPSVIDETTLYFVKDE